MTDLREILAHHVREALKYETGEELARRCGIVVKNKAGRMVGNKNYIHRAAHPDEEHGDPEIARRYSPTLSDNAVKLLTGLNLTFSPVESITPTVAQITELIGRMEAEPAAKEVAIAAVHAARMARRQERAA